MMSMQAYKIKAFYAFHSSVQLQICQIPHAIGYGPYLCGIDNRTSGIPRMLETRQYIDALRGGL
jgi:hypothetical protein